MGYCVNANLEHLSITSHDRLFPFSAAGLMCSFLQEQISYKEALLSIEGMSREQYMAHSMNIHDVLDNEKDISAIKRWNTSKTYSRELQLLWSSSMPRGTARDFEVIPIRKTDWQDLLATT